MKKIRLILIVALAVSTIVSSSFALGLIRVKAIASTAVDPHQATVEICSSPPTQVQQQEDPLACEGGSANCNPLGCPVGSSPETLAYAFGVDCLHVVPAGAADPCATPLVASSVAITFAFQNPNFNPSEPLIVHVTVNGVLITNFPGNGFSRGTVPLPGGFGDGSIPASGDIQPTGTTSGVFSILFWANQVVNPTSMSQITSVNGNVAPTCATTLNLTPGATFPTHCITSTSQNFLEVTIVSGEQITFNGITAIVGFPQ